MIEKTFSPAVSLQQALYDVAVVRGVVYAWELWFMDGSFLRYDEDRGLVAQSSREELPLPIHHAWCNDVALHSYLSCCPLEMLNIMDIVLKIQPPPFEEQGIPSAMQCDHRVRLTVRHMMMFY